MITGLWGKKIGMTQIFEKDKVVPVTVINLGQWIVTQVKTAEKDGYSAIQVGCIKDRYASQEFSPEWLKTSKKYLGVIKEIRMPNDEHEMKVGQLITDFESLFPIGSLVDIQGITTGRGFAGVVRRHGFSGGGGSHGSRMGDRPGSVGGLTACGKIMKGKKMPGRMGAQQRMMKGLEIIKVAQDDKLVLVKGSIPGKEGSLVFIRKTKA